MNENLGMLSIKLEDPQQYINI